MPKYDKDIPCFFTQQPFLIGTYDEEGSPHFATISWVSYTWGQPACLIASMNGKKKTKENIARTGMFSATLLIKEFLPLAETGKGGKALPGEVLAVPLLEGATFSYECRVIEQVELGSCMTYFGAIEAVRTSKEIEALEFMDLTKIQPVIYGGYHYFTVGRHLGQIGDFSPKEPR